MEGITRIFPEITHPPLSSHCVPNRLGRFYECNPDSSMYVRAMKEQVDHVTHHDRLHPNCRRVSLYSFRVYFSGVVKWKVSGAEVHVHLNF